jgi:hypothetical protein
MGLGWKCRTEVVTSSTAQKNNITYYYVSWSTRNVSEFSSPCRNSRRTTNRLLVMMKLMYE